MKMFVVAVTMAMAGAANAAYVSPNTGNGTMVFWAYDSTNANNGFVADLGETFSSFGLGHAAESWSLASALSAIAPANLVWGVGAGATTLKTGLYTSLASTFMSLSVGNRSALTNMDSDFSGLNFDGCGTSCATTRVGALQWGNNWGVLATNTGGAVNDVMNFFQVVSGSKATQPVAVTQYGGTFSFNSAGFLSYNATAAAVPVPAAIWLFGSALVGMVGVTRRVKRRLGHRVRAVAYCVN